MVFLPVIVGYANLKIVPGRSVGDVRVARSLPSTLGKPTYSDSAMGKSLLTWIGRDGHRLDVFVASKGDGPGEDVRVDYVRTTSPDFRLPSGLRVGSPSDALHRAYPHAKPLYAPKGGPTDRPILMDDVKRGIAWLDVPTSKVAALIVHAPGRPLTYAEGVVPPTPRPASAE